MLYKPNFCCSCGEKIERSDWTLLTSRRFCGVCESENKKYDLLPRGILAAGVLIGLFGAGTYLQTRNPTVLQKQPNAVALKQSVSKPSNVSSADSVINPTHPQNGAENGPANINEQRPESKNSSTEAIYFCGAVTKKGTPCSRRVKTRGRCWQHAGKPA